MDSHGMVLRQARLRKNPAIGRKNRPDRSRNRHSIFEPATGLPKIGLSGSENLLKPSACDVEEELYTDTCPDRKTAY